MDADTVQALRDAKALFDEGILSEQEFKEKLEVLKEDRKDDRVKQQAVEQSKLVSQRQGSRGELPEEMSNVKITRS